MSTWDLDDAHIPDVDVTPAMERAARALVAATAPDVYNMILDAPIWTGKGHQNGTIGRRRAIQRRNKGLGKRADQ